MIDREVFDKIVNIEEKMFSLFPVLFFSYDVPTKQEMFILGELRKAWGPLMAARLAAKGYMRDCGLVD